MTFHRSSALALWIAAVSIIVSLHPAAGAPGSGPKIATSDTTATHHRVIFDFTAPNAEPWSSVDDVVMGGLSSSRMVVEDGRAVFKGEISLENKGGFASVWSPPEGHDLKDFDGLAMRVRGDGQRYSFRVRIPGQTEDDIHQYQVKFEASEEGWQTRRFPFTAFEAVFRGRHLPEAPSLEPEKIRTFGFLITDRQEGPFKLEIAEIRAFRD